MIERLLLKIRFWFVIKLKVECTKDGIDVASKIIIQGGIAIFPTDTVYGIGCDPYNKKSVEKIYKIKQRKREKLFPVLGYSVEELEKIAMFNENSRTIIENFWPGQITIVTKIKDEKIKSAMNLDDKIAIRIPNNECVLSLLEKCRLIVGTSANISGEGSFTNSDDCLKNLKEYDVIVDGGKIQSKGESTIVECIDNSVKILRKGSISEEEILKKL